jgi:hypothetical protein
MYRHGLELRSKITTDGLSADLCTHDRESFHQRCAHAARDAGVFPGQFDASLSRKHRRDSGRIPVRVRPLLMVRVRRSSA